MSSKNCPTALLLALLGLDWLRLECALLLTAAQFAWCCVVTLFSACMTLTPWHYPDDHPSHSIQILPLENSRGRDLVESGRLCERKNGRGVDPNRNWEIDWGKKEKDYDPNEENPGPGPFR